MKLINSNGKRLTVREVGEEMFSMTPRDPLRPLPIITNQIMEDGDARALLSDLKETRNYRSERIG